MSVQTENIPPYSGASANAQMPTDYDSFDGINTEGPVKETAASNQSGQTNGKTGMSSAQRDTLVVEQMRANGAGGPPNVNGTSSAPVDKPGDIEGVEGSAESDPMEDLQSLLDKIERGVTDPDTASVGDEDLEAGRSKPDASDPPDVPSGTARTMAGCQGLPEVEGPAQSFTIEEAGDDTPAADGVSTNTGPTMGAVMKRLARLMASMTMNMADMQQSLELNSLNMANSAKNTQINAAKTRMQVAEDKYEADTTKAWAQIGTAIASGVGSALGAAQNGSLKLVGNVMSTLSKAGQGAAELYAAGYNLKANIGNAQADMMNSQASFVEKMGQNSSTSANRMSQAINAFLQNFRSFADTVNSATTAMAQNIR